jgi:hypothetical protein
MIRRMVSRCRGNSGNSIEVLGETTDIQRLNQLSTDGSDDWLLITSQGESEVAARWLTTPKSDVDVVVISKSSGAALVNEVGSAIASLILSQELTNNVLISPQVRRTAEGFRDIQDPVGDFVIRAALANPQRVQWLVEATSSRHWALPSRDEALLWLVPQTPGREQNWLREHTQNLPLRKLLTTISSPTDLLALQAGLWQMHDFLDESHACSQQIEGEGIDRNGDYWHAIMHRREPDFENSKYWFRRVGQHPIFKQLPEIAQQALSDYPEAATWCDRLCRHGQWDAFAFVDLCQAAHRTEESPLANAARRIQWAEMLLLLMHSYRCVVGTRSLS